MSPRVITGLLFRYFQMLVLAVYTLTMKKKQLIERLLLRLCHMAVVTVSSGNILLQQNFKAKQL
jgi:hypothetical protein